MTDPLHPEVAEQMDSVAVAPGRPLVITDADEVVVNFIDRFADFLPEHGFSFTWASYHLTGNVVRDNGRPAGKDDMARVFRAFYDSHTADLDPVPGAIESLTALGERATVVVLSNLSAPLSSCSPTCRCRTALSARAGSRSTASMSRSSPMSGARVRRSGRWRTRPRRRSSSSTTARVTTNPWPTARPK